MRDLDKALDDILAIRSQIAAGTAFRGYGPAALAATGALALATAAAQALWLEDPTGRPLLFLGIWTAAAVVAAVIIAVEMLRRSRRHHSGLADAMIHQAVEQFLPAAGAGALLAVVLVRYAPAELWMLPGLWQVLVGVGIFASARSLPRATTLVAAWYLLAGFAVLIWASGTHLLSPWAMGLPFAVGQLLGAVVLQHACGGADAED
jgi:hypothetical protein